MAAPSLSEFIDMDYDEGVAKGGVACPFPWRLHKCLADCEENLSDIISWAPHGRAFTVHKPKAFVEDVMPRYFGQTKYPSFQRQLNLYGFSRFAHGKDKGSYYHLCFVRGHTHLVHQMVRRKVKGNKVRHTIEASSEPDFYHPAWDDHFEASYPPKLLEQQCAAVVKALCEKAIYDARMNKSNTEFGKVPSALVENDTPSVNSEMALKSNDQVLILPRIPVLTPTISPKPSTVFSSNDSKDGAASWISAEDPLKDGDLITFEGIPFHFLDDNVSDDFHNSTLSTLGAEDDNFSLCSVRRCVSNSFFGNVDTSFLLDQDPFLNNLTAV